MKTTEFTFVGEKGATIFCRRWEPDAGDRRGVVLLVHGYAEHAGRYTALSAYLTERGYTLYAPDHRSHGRSEGRKALVEDIEDIVRDLHTLRRRIAVEQPGKKVFALGHSMGGALALWFILRHQEEVDGAILSGVALKAGAGVSPLVKLISKALAVIAPTTGVQELNSDWLSHDVAVCRAYDEDPLNYRGKVMARTGAELLRCADYALAHIHEVRIPVLCMHGGNDQLIDPESSRYLCEHIGSSDKTLKIFDGLYHEIYNEFEKNDVYALVGDWLDRHIA